MPDLSTRRTWAGTISPHGSCTVPGYRPEQVQELAATIAAVPCDLVLAATPIDLTRLIQPERPLLRVFYGIAETDGTPLREAFLKLVDPQGCRS